MFLGKNLNLLRVYSLHNNASSRKIYSLSLQRHYAAKIVPKSGAQQTEAAVTSTSNQLQRLRAIIQQKKTTSSTVDSTQSSTKLQSQQKSSSSSNDETETEREWTEPVEAAASIRVETIVEEDDINPEDTYTKKKPPKFWSEDTAALKRLREQGLEYPGTLLERGLDKSVSGRIYTEDDPAIIQNIADNCLLMVRYGGDAYMNLAKKSTSSAGSTSRKHLFVRALTHVNYGNGKVPTNEQLSFMGKFTLESIISDIVAEKYPDLPWRELNMIRAIYVCESTLAYVGRELWGLIPVLRVYMWDDMTVETQDKFMAQCVQAIIGAVYDTCGPRVARQFITDCFLGVLHSYQQQDKTKSQQQSSPQELFGLLLNNSNPIRLLNDLLYAQQFVLPKTIFSKEQDPSGKFSEYSCSLYQQSTLVGFARSKNKYDAHLVAANNACLQLASRLPNY